MIDLPIEFQHLGLPGGGSLHILKMGHLWGGFSEIGFSSADLRRYIEPRRLLFLKQVHGARIVTAGEWSPGIEADGLLLSEPGCVAVVQTADCVPLFFADRRGRAVGVIHVGWRGLLQGIEATLLHRLATSNVGACELDFFLGPAISGTCYEVGEDVRVAFRFKSYQAAIFSPQKSGKFLLDIKRGIHLSLTAAGVSGERIIDCGLCTHCLPERFPSFRRDGGTGRRIFNFAELTV